MNKQEKGTFGVQNTTMVYRMPKELDHHVAKELCRELDMLVEGFQILELILDFERTEFMDSSGIGVLIGRSKTMKYRSGKLCVTHMGRRVNLIFQSAGLGKIIEVREEV